MAPMARKEVVKAMRQRIVRVWEYHDFQRAFDRKGNKARVVVNIKMSGDMVVEFSIDAKLTTIYIRHLRAELLKNTENDKGNQG